MTEIEAKELLQAKLTCIEKESRPICSEDGCDRNCDGCNYCYAQGTIGEQKQALAMAIQALEYMAKLKGMGECYIIPKSSPWEINGIDVHKALEKQVPKKPLLVPMDDTCLYHEKHCPNCESLLVARYKHCPKCGQKLDW